MANRDDDFTYAELIEYEDLAGESVDELKNEEKPRLKKIAYLGWIRAKRENQALSFVDYINNTEAEQIVKDAFGSPETDEEKKETNSDKPVRNAKRGSV